MFKFIFWVALAILALVLCVVTLITGNWLAFSLSIVAFVLDTVDAILALKKWLYWRKK